MRVGGFGRLVVGLTGAANAFASTPVAVEGVGFHSMPLQAESHDLIELARPQAWTRGHGSAGLILGHSQIGLSAHTDGGQAMPLLERVTCLSSSGTFAFHDRVQASVVAPVYLSVVAGDASPAAAMGDVQVGVHGVWWASPEDSGAAITLGVLPFLQLPTGDASRYVGHDGWAGGARLTASAVMGDFAPTFNTGFRWTPEASGDGDVDPDAALMGVGLAWSGDALGLSLEMSKDLYLNGNALMGTGPAEAIATARWMSDRQTQWLAGLGAGLSDGIGAPALRIFVGTALGGATPAGQPAQAGVASTSGARALPVGVSRPVGAPAWAHPVEGRDQN